MKSIVARIALVAFVCASAAFASAAFAQPYPSKPVRLIVPSGAGGPIDSITRGLAQLLGESLGQAFIVENRGGAEGIIGAEACAKSPPDGYTLCSTAVNVITYNMVLRSKLPYDSARDFAPVALYGFLDAAIVVHPSVPANSIAELVALAKAKPDTITWASFGPNTPSVLFMEWLRRNTGASFLHVPYKTASQSHLANVAGEVQVNYYGAGQVAQMVKAGKLRALAVTGDKPLSYLPGVPTMKEAGIDVNTRTWYGLFAPAGTPREIVQRLNAEVAKAKGNRDFVEKFMNAQGITPAAPVTPEEFATFLARDREEFAALAKTIGLKPE